MHIMCIGTREGRFREPHLAKRIANTEGMAGASAMFTGDFMEFVEDLPPQVRERWNVSRYSSPRDRQSTQISSSQPSSFTPEKPL